jgi:hypothetical protein
MLFHYYHSGHILSKDKGFSEMDIKSPQNISQIFNRASGNFNSFGFVNVSRFCLAKPNMQKVRLA